MEGDAVLSPQSQPARAYRQFATIPKSIPDKLQLVKKHSLTMNDETEKEGRDVETDHFLKFLEGFWRDEYSFFEYIPFNRSIDEREMINPPFVPCVALQLLETIKKFDILSKYNSI